MSPKNALVLMCSPHREHGSSANIGRYFAESFRGKGLAVEEIIAYDSTKDDDKRQALVKAFDTADLVLICFPLYVDTLPAGLLGALDHIHAHRAELAPRARLLAAECQSGFPEASQNDTALRCCAHFAERMGMRYAGGMAMGEGGMLGQSPLRDLKYAKNHMPLFDRAADSLTRGESIPQDVLDGVRRPFVPRWMYVMIVNRSWNKMARANGVGGLIREKTYLKD